MNRLFTLLFYATFSSFSCLHASATPLKLDLHEAIDMAVKNSEEMQVQGQEKAKSEARVAEAKSGLFPQITAEAKWTRNMQIPYSHMNMGGATINIPLKERYEAQAGVTATQVLWAFGKVSLAIDLAQQSVDLAASGEGVARNELIYYTKMAYYAVLLAKKSVEIAEASVNNAKQNKYILEGKLAAGRPSKGDSIKMAADIAARIPQWQSAKNNQELALNSLRKILGLNDATEIDLTTTYVTDFPEMNKSHLRQEMLGKAPLIKTLDNAIGLNEKLVDLKKAINYPTLAGFGTWNYMGAGEKRDIGGSDKFQQYSAVGLVLTMPFDIGGGKLWAVEQAVNDLNIAKLKKDSTIKNLNLDLENALDEYMSLRETYRANIEAVRLAESSYSMMRSMFQTGKLALSNLNDAEILVTSQKMQAEATLFKINTTLAKIEKLSAKEN